MTFLSHIAAVEVQQTSLQTPTLRFIWITGYLIAAGMLSDCHADQGLHEGCYVKWYNSAGGWG
jgi:hypothetical protein